MILACHGGFSLDEATRRSWYNPDAILKDLRFGMVLVDVGCGEGFFSILAAKKVGDKGRVYAVDIDSSAIAKLKNNAEAEGLPNIVTVVGRAEDTVFCDQCADFVLYSMNLHDFADPEKVLRNAKQMIKPDGQIIDLDWKKEEMPFGPPSSIRFSEEQACSLMRSAGFSAINSNDAGLHHYIVTAKI